MSKKTDALSGVQITALVAATIIATGVMSLASDAAEEMNTDGAIATFLAGMIVLGLTYLIGYLSKRFAGRTILDYSRELLGMLPSKGINFILCIYFVVISSAVVRTFAAAIKLFLLEKTPIEVIIFSILLVSGYLVQNGINPVARMCEALLPILVVSLSLLLVLSLQNFDIKEFYSVWQIDPMNLIRVIPKTLLAYLGFEVVLFAGAYAAKPDKVTQYSLVGVGIAVGLYTATVAVCIGVFTNDDLSYLIYPTLELAKTISFPGAFAERFDIFFAIFWVLAVFTSLSVFHYLAAFSVTRLIGMRNYRPFSYFLIPPIYFISLIPQNIFENQLFSRWVSYLGAVVAAGIPALLFVVSLIRRKGGEKNEEA